MSKIVLFEDIAPAAANLVTESRKGSKDVYLRGIYMQGDIENGNQRIYPVDEIAKAVDEISEKIKSGFSVLGELNHPDTLSINLDRVSHTIVEMKMVGNNAIGKAKILNTPMGIIVKNLIDEGIKLGVSSRGSGNVNDGIVSDFNFVTVDIVANPSAPDAYPDVVTESLRNVGDSKKIMTLAEAARHDPAAQKFLKKELFKFIDSFTKK